ncbi:hypothetical protein F3Y22_tig00110705pilonHSYRG00093 [Hibiscus syriacus]|uniref:FAD-binding PCMH-type domain-containing protein n=1 Tax=Hibiscus syriacus TaxID=106335 RepID=A0A6A2ZUA9_HIBSY|nr:hypothetical protein F3Y22_tig00110705pilonHSYRG00093 [Hibiscus syriacus]
MNYPNPAIFPLLTLALLLLSSLPCPATSHSSSSSLDNFLQCIANKSAPLLESVYTPTNPSFDLVLRALIRNRRFSTPKPVAIVAPTRVSHVQATVFCARVDVSKEVAYVQAGATLGELYYKIANASNVHAFPAGVCTGLGTGGHFSGGGYGKLIRKYGLSVDNIVDAQVVEVNGKIINRALMGEDLFWAIRGGGGASFAVIVAWKIKLVRVPAKVTVFNVPFTLEQGATDVAFKWQQVAPKLPDVLFIRLQPSVVNGARDYSKNKSDYVKTLIPKSGLETIWKLLIELANTTTANVIMQSNPYGGKFSEIPASSTPFPHRSGNLFLVQYIIFCDEEELNVTDHNVDRVRYMHDRMALDALVYGSKYFKDNFPRLTTVKAMADPDNFFKNEQSIPPNIN